MIQLNFPAFVRFRFRNIRTFYWRTAAAAN